MPDVSSSQSKDHTEGNGSPSSPGCTQDCCLDNEGTHSTSPTHENSRTFEEFPNMFLQNKCEGNIAKTIKVR